MFEAASDKFAKSVGFPDILPVPSLDQSRQCSPFQVVIKRNRRFRWQSSTYTPSPYNLSQLLVNGDEDPLQKHITLSTREAVIYNRLHKLNVKGKIGAKIKVLLDMELEGSDTVDVEAKFGNVNITSVDETELLTVLKTRHLNLEHDYIRQVREHPRKVLCVVVASYALNAAGTVIAKKDIKGEEQVGEDKVVKNLAEASEDVSVEDDNENSMIVPPNTVIGYKLYELLVKSDKSIELLIAKDLSGGFKVFDEVDGASNLGACRASLSSHNLNAVAEPSLADSFQLFLSMETNDRDQLKQAVLQMCTFPKDIDTFLVMIKQALALVKEEEATGIGLNKTTFLSVLKSKFLCPDQDWATLLQFCGFSFIVDGSVEFPRLKSTFLEPMVNLYKALIELDDTQLIIFSRLTPHFAQPLVYISVELIKGRPVNVKNELLDPLFECDNNHARDFCASLNINIELQKIDFKKGGRVHELQGAARALYALFWIKDWDKQLKWKCAL